jgi:hypothetical protein
MIGRGKGEVGSGGGGGCRATDYPQYIMVTVSSYNEASWYAIYTLHYQSIHCLPLLARREIKEIKEIVIGE